MSSRPGEDSDELRRFFEASVRVPFDADSGKGYADVAGDYLQQLGDRAFGERLAKEPPTVRARVRESLLYYFCDTRGGMVDERDIEREFPVTFPKDRNATAPSPSGPRSAGAAPEPADTPEKVARRILIGRYVVMAGLLLLVYSFFLDFQTAELRGPSAPSVLFSAATWPCLFPFNFFAAMVIVYIPRLVRWERAERALGHLSAVLALASLFAYEWFRTYQFHPSSQFDPGTYAFRRISAPWAVFYIMLIVSVWIKAPPAQRTPIVVGMLGAGSCVYFGVIFLGYWCGEGVLTSVLGSFLLLVGGIKEARARSAPPVWEPRPSSISKER